MRGCRGSGGHGPAEESKVRGVIVSESNVAAQAELQNVNTTNTSTMNAETAKAVKTNGEVNGAENINYNAM
jgi:hypothetical protein